ncbi:hypothetical protein UA08_03413 [Talaromyces atroroseus]|uniref:DUF7708 domain-containing protein n=1 Tax=Talaromyces atroroseus TaxID=1441469 RepID=A0A225AHC5_TALAT|nr:hypothetical protein UA08_03413 [Talaromyces atroroseus]OKL60821.1 hypothetical protein UA08_03413 [Talaromyces atroroseus]
MSGPKVSDNDKNRACLERSEHAQSKLLESVRCQKGFSDAEKGAMNLQSACEFREYWIRVTMSQGNFDDNHEHGCGLCVRRSQASSKVVLTFMDDFSPLVDAVKGCIPGYGGLAIATVSLLFLVARNKDGIEKNLASTIEAIRDRLPAMDLYKHIYDENHALDHEMQTRVIAAYETFMEFCISAIEYYKGSGIWRWFRALAPGSTSIATNAARVHTSIIGIRQLGEELVAKNCGYHQEGKGRVSDLDRKLFELQDSFSEAVIDCFRATFQLQGLSDDSQNQYLEHYRVVVSMDQRSYAGVLEQMSGTSLDRFVNSGVYHQWYTAEQSCLLILSGHNDNGSISPQCWLSPVALWTIDDCRRVSSTVYAYYIVPHEGATIYQVLSGLLLQLIRREKSILRDESQRDAFKRKMYEYQQRTTSAENYKYGESESLYMVVDRADRCRNFRDYDHREALKDGLKTMIYASRCQLKILAVFDGIGWDEDEKGAGQSVMQQTISQRLV